MLKLLNTLMCKIQCFAMDIGQARAVSGFRSMRMYEQAQNLQKRMKGYCKCSG